MATAAVSDKFDRVTDSTTGRPVISKLGGSGKSIGASSITLANSTNWTVSSKIHFAIYLLTSAGVKDPTTQTDWTGTLIGSTISNLSPTGGTDRSYTTDAYVDLTPTAAWGKDLYDGLAVSHNPDGSLLTSAVQTALNLGAGSLNGWNALGYTPATVTHNGNRSYDLVFNSVDLTGTISPAMRLRTTRTVAAPTQSTSLNGTNQYYTKSSPAGMAQTDSITTMQWVKPSAYQAGLFQSKTATPGTDGWQVYMNANGTVTVNGNARFATTTQSLPLNKWTHIATTLSMSTSTVNVYFDGVLVSSSALSGAGATFTSAGNYAIGATSAGATLFAGKLAQVAVFSAVLSQATILGYISQTLANGTTSLISAYSFNNAITDINTTNANNLTANGSAVATNADSPYGGQASGSISGTLDYAIIQKAVFSTNTTITVQVPEGSTIPTSGGIASIVYSSAGKPYGMPTQRKKWRVQSIVYVNTSQGTAVSGTWYNVGGHYITAPTGEWRATKQHSPQIIATSDTLLTGTLSTSSTAETDIQFTSEHRLGTSAVLAAPHYLEGDISVPSATFYYMNLRQTGGTSVTLYNNVGAAPAVISLDNAYL